MASTWCDRAQVTIVEDEAEVKVYHLDNMQDVEVDKVRDVDMDEVKGIKRYRSWISNF